MAFTHNNVLLACGNGEGSITLWDIQYKERFCVLTDGHKEAIASVSFDGTGTSLASVSDEGTIFVWNIQTNTVTQMLSNNFVGAVGGNRFGAVRFILNNRGLVGAYTNSDALAVWKVSDGKQQLSIQAVAGDLTRASFQKALSIGDSQTTALTVKADRLASVQRDHSIVTYDICMRRGLKLRHVLVGHRDTICCVSFNNAGDMLATGSTDGMLITWDVIYGVPVATINTLVTGPHVTVNGIGFNSSSSNIVATTNCSFGYIFHVITGELLGTIKKHSSRPSVATCVCLASTTSINVM
jgi:WD40 repeat protein